MTQQTAPSMQEMLEAAVASAKWEVGKTYLTVGRFGRRSKVLILAVGIKNEYSVVGVQLAEDAESDDSVETWRPDGSYCLSINAGSSMNLTTELA